MQMEVYIYMHMYIRFRDPVALSLKIKALYKCKLLILEVIFKAVPFKDS